MPAIDYRSSLVNSLSTNTHLLLTDDKPINLKNMQKLIRYALFLDALLDALPERVNNHIVAFITVVSELVTDYNCLSEEPNDLYYDFGHTFFKHGKVNLNFSDIVGNVIQPANGGDAMLTFDIAESNSVYFFIIQEYYIRFY